MEVPDDFLLKNDAVGLDPPKAPAGTIGFSARRLSNAIAGDGSSDGGPTSAAEGEGVFDPPL